MVWPSFFGGGTQWSSVQTITTSRVVFLEGLEGQSSGEVVMEGGNQSYVGGNTSFGDRMESGVDGGKRSFKQIVKSLQLSTKQ